MLMLYFIRHGEYEGNLEKGRLHGRSDNRSLNPLGVVQSRGVSRFIAENTITGIFSSPVRRSMQTARLIANVSNNHSVCVDDRLNELNYGILEGKTIADIQAMFPDARKEWEKSDRLFLKFPQGESFEELFIRTQDFVKSMEAMNVENKEQTFVVVTHLAIIHAFIILANGGDHHEIFAISTHHPVPNASVTKAVYEPKRKWSVEYSGKICLYPPQTLLEWVQLHFKGITAIEMHPGFSKSYVVSFLQGTEHLNVKFYGEQEKEVAKKIITITDFVTKNTSIPIKPILRVDETHIKEYPLAVVTPHIPTQKREVSELASDKALAQHAADILKQLHANSFVPSVASFWQSQEYVYPIQNAVDWKRFIQVLFSLRFEEAKKAGIENRVQMTLMILEEWFKKHCDEIKDTDIVPLHGDFYPNNMCMDNSQITALLDFDSAMIGHTFWEFGITRQRSETYFYPHFSDNLEKSYGIEKPGFVWILFYTLLEFIGSYANNVLKKSFQQYFDERKLVEYEYRFKKDST